MTHEFKEMIDDMHDELEGAHHYTELWHKFKGKDSDAENFREMADQEMKHAQRFLEMGDRIVKKDGMTEADKAIWHWEREKAEKRMAKIKGMMSM